MGTDTGVFVGKTCGEIVVVGGGRGYVRGLSGYVVVAVHDG